MQGALQEGGTDAVEVFVLLAARWLDDHTVEITSAYVPDQRPGTHAKGFSVTVPGEELARLNRLWFENREFLAAQVHSHPTWPFHSPTDDGYAMTTQEGSISIVIGLFGYLPLDDLSACAVFRLEATHWTWLSPNQVRDLVEIV